MTLKLFKLLFLVSFKWNGIWMTTDCYCCSPPIITWTTEIIGYDYTWWWSMTQRYRCNFPISLRTHNNYVYLITHRASAQKQSICDHLSFRMSAVTVQLLTLKCFPVSALCRLVWTLSIWRCTVKIQSHQWCASWIYTWEFITWLASFALFIEQGEWDYNLNADSVVFTLSHMTAFPSQCPC